MARNNTVNQEQLTKNAKRIAGIIELHGCIGADYHKETKEKVGYPSTFIIIDDDQIIIDELAKIFGVTTPTPPHLKVSTRLAVRIILETIEPYLTAVKAKEDCAETLSVIYKLDAPKEA